MTVRSGEPNEVAVRSAEPGRVPSRSEGTEMSGQRHWTPKVWQRPSEAFCPMPPTGWWCSAPQDHSVRGTSCPTRRARPWERSWWCGLRGKHVLRHKGRGDVLMGRVLSCCGHEAERHGPEAGVCIECRCRVVPGRGLSRQEKIEEVVREQMEDRYLDAVPGRVPSSPTSEEKDMSVTNELRALRAIVAVVQRMSPASRRWLIARLTADA